LDPEEDDFLENLLRTKIMKKENTTMETAMCVKDLTTNETS